MGLKKPTPDQIGKTIVYFVRHGDRLHIPNTPPPHDFSLSELGKRQAKEVAMKFAKIKDEIDFLYTSPMKRARETAEEISKSIGKKAVIVRSFYEINKELARDKKFTYNYWKSYFQVRAAMKDLDKILLKNIGKVIIIVAHGGLIRTLIGQKLGLSIRKSNMFDYNNCHISLVRFKGKKLDYIHYFNSKELV